MVGLAPAIFSGIFLLQAYATRDVKIRIYKVLIAIVLLLGAYYLQTTTAKVLPVLIQLMLMYYFGRTLLKGKGPSFIESFVRLEFRNSGRVSVSICRQLTILVDRLFCLQCHYVCCRWQTWGTDFWWMLYNSRVISI